MRVNAIRVGAQSRAAGRWNHEGQALGLVGLEDLGVAAMGLLVWQPTKEARSISVQRRDRNANFAALKCCGGGACRMASGGSSLSRMSPS